MPCGRPAKPLTINNYMRWSVAALAVLPLPALAQAQADTPPVMTRLPRDLSVWGMFVSADWLVQAVMVGLVVASVVTWTVFVSKSLEVAAAMRRQREVS